MADWATISALATAGGTLALAGATYAAVRSSNRSARVAEQALQEQRRPLVVQARLDDPAQEVRFVDGHVIHTQGADAVIEPADGVLYLAMSVRNVGNGIAVVQGWYPWPSLETTATPHPPVDRFRPHTRDIYLAPDDTALWQGALRDPDEPIFGEMAAVADRHETFTIDLLYTDQVGGQRTISRFSLSPAGDGRWNTSVGRHWSLDGMAPR